MIMTRDEAKPYARAQLNEYLTRYCGVDNTTRNFRCLCNTHRDSTPSMSFDRERQQVHCFGCGCTMDIFDLVGEQYGLTEAADKFNKTYELLNITIDDAPRRTAQNAHKPESPTDIKGIIERAQKCRTSTEAASYLNKRGISQETAERFNIGYIPDFKTKDNDTEKFTAWRVIVIPTDGGFTARNIDECSKANRIRKKGKNTHFNSDALLSKKSPVFVVEGEFDALSIEELGYPAVSLGSVANVREFARVYTEIGATATVCISLDNDDAGQSATEELKSILQKKKIPFVSSNIAGKYKDANERLVSDRKGLEKELAAARSLKPTTGESNGRRLIKWESAKKLSEEEMKPIKYFVEKMLPQGLTVLASPPKYGKSWFVLDLCISVTSGKQFLGRETKQCSALYLALEDSKNRLQSRINAILQGEIAPEKLKYSIECDPLDNGLIEQLTAYMEEVPDTGLIVIDTMQKIRGKMRASENAYGYDYKEMGQLKAFADKYGICLLLVHHLRKGKDDGDVFMNFSGTNGIIGAADTMLALSRDKRDDEKTTLSITGRDVENAAYSLVFDNDACKWRTLGTTEEERERAELEAYKNNPIIRTLKYLLEPTGEWRGTATELNTAIIEHTGEFLSETGNSATLSKSIRSLQGKLFNVDKLTYEPPKNSSRGCRIHKFKDTTRKYLYNIPNIGK